MGYKVGDIVRFENEGDSLVGILYENGNKEYGDFRAKALGIKKYRGLSESDLTPATPEEMETYNAISAVGLLTPESVIKQETDEAGGILPGPLPKPEPEQTDDNGNVDDGN